MFHMPPYYRSIYHSQSLQGHNLVFQLPNKVIKIDSRSVEFLEFHDCYTLKEKFFFGRFGLFTGSMFRQSAGHCEARNVDLFGKTFMPPEIRENSFLSKVEVFPHHHVVGPTRSQELKKSVKNQQEISQKLTTIESRAL